MSPHPLAQRPSSTRVATTRRTTVAAALAGGSALVGGLSGCDVGDPDRPGASAEPAPDPDGELLDRARTEVDEVLALVAALTARHRRMAPGLRDLLALHTAHRVVLAESGTPTATPTSAGLSGAPDELWTLLLLREHTLQRRLAAWAVQASSGTLARLLASMSAGIAAHVAAARAAADAGVSW